MSNLRKKYWDSAQRIKNVVNTYDNNEFKFYKEIAYNLSCSFVYELNFYFIFLNQMTFAVLYLIFCF